MDPQFWNQKTGTEFFRKTIAFNGNVQLTFKSNYIDEIKRELIAE